VFFEFYPKKVKKGAEPPQQDSKHSDHEDHDNSDNSNLDHEVVPVANTAEDDEENEENNCNGDENDNDDDDELGHDEEENHVSVNNATEEQCDHVDLEINGDILDAAAMSGQLEGRLDNHHNDCEARAEVVSRPVLKLAMPEPEAAPEAVKELMSDGEVMRECRPGFQDLKNCKRFWQAQQLIGTRKEGPEEDVLSLTGAPTRKLLPRTSTPTYFQV
jgi:hypothetical protein